jgi:hypothetical protein
MASGEIGGFLIESATRCQGFEMPDGQTCDLPFLQLVVHRSVLVAGVRAVQEFGPSLPD